MRAVSKTYIALMCGGWCIFADATLARAQGATTTDANASSCAAVLANDSTVGTRIGPTDSARRDTSARGLPDSASFGVGGARSGPADVLLLVGIHADEVRFASQPHLRVRQRDNLPSPIVPGTTYRNVYIAVELLGRVNAECLADIIGVGNNAPRNARPANCAFLGATAGTGVQNTKPPPQ